MKKKLAIRGFLLHLSHYDPLWNQENWRNKFPFDLNLGLDIIDEMTKNGLNTLIVDCEDAVCFKSHPELSRTYTVPIKQLKKLVQHAAEKNIEVIPKLNFSQSRVHCHNDWMRPHGQCNGAQDIFDSEKYWKIAFELIDELVDVCNPRYFHIGMDEDTERSCRLFAMAINILHAGLSKRNLRTVMWRDSRTDLRGEVFTEKHNFAEDKIAQDIIPMVWKYDRAISPKIIKHIVQKGFELWGTTGETASPDVILAWKKVLLKNDATGLILTKWIPCNEINRSSLLEYIKELGPEMN